MSGWSRAQMMCVKNIENFAQQQDDDVSVILKIMQTGGFFSMAQILEIRMEKYIFCDFIGPLTFCIGFRD